MEADQNEELGNEELLPPTIRPRQPLEQTHPELSGPPANARGVFVREMGFARLQDLSLKEWRVRQEVERNSHGESWREGGWVFTGRKGGRYAGKCIEPCTIDPR